MDLSQFDSVGSLLQGTELAQMSVHDGTSCVRHDVIDLDAWQGVVGAVPELASLVHEAKQTAPNAPALLRDLFFTFYKAYPEVLQHVPLRESHAANRQLIEHTMEAVAWKDLRATGTVEKQFPSALATHVVGRSLLKHSAKLAKRVASTAEEEEAVSLLLARAETLEDIAQRSPDKAKSLYDRASTLRAEAVARNGKLMPVLFADDDLTTIDNDTRFGLLAAKDVVDENEQALDAFTCDQAGGYGTSPGQYRRPLSLDEHMRLTERVKRNQRFKEVAALAGRLRRIALHKQRERVVHEPDEIVGFEFGRDLRRVVPAEKALLGHPYGRQLFGLRFVGNALQQYRIESFAKKGEGPVIVVEDQSLSEQANYGAHKGIVWNKSAVLGLAAICQLRKRDLCVIEFSGKGNLRTTVYKHGRMETNEALDYVDRTFNGGTYYDDWMREALRVAQESAFDKADVILLSDGLAQVNESVALEWNRVRQARGMKAFACMTGPDTSYAQQVLGGLCDAIVSMADLADDDEATDVLFSI